MLKRPENSELSLPSSIVLVVDDAAGARFLVAKILGELGFQTLIASDGASALKAIHDFQPDALVTDLEMPGIDGEVLIEAIRTNKDPMLREIPIIVCSSKVDEATAVEAERLGADAVVPKPVDVGLLARTATELFSSP